MIYLTRTQRKALLEELGELGKFSKVANLLASKIQSSPVLSQYIAGESMTHASTTRNKLLITDEDQQKLVTTTVGFFGLSVGSHAALTWMMLSRAINIKIADPDIISPSNLNRLRLGWSAVGKQKIDVTKKQLLDMHPATHVYTLAKTGARYMKAFCAQSPRVDCIVDEIDDLEGKMLLRSLARVMQIPLISAVDVGENVIIDIERYDTQPKTKFFLGRIPDVEQINFASLTPLQKARLIIQLVGLEHNSNEMLNSLLAIGKEIGTWPQLGSTATIAGGIVATIVAKIILGAPIKSGRYVFEMDKLLGLSITKPEVKRQLKLKKSIRDTFEI